MNPKNMTKEELIKSHADARAFAENSDYDLARNGALKVSEDCASELLHRLDEIDALRKENEELRDALIDARSWMDAGMFEDVPPQYTAMVANVDAMLSKESEASHE